MIQPTIGFKRYLPQMSHKLVMCTSGRTTRRLLESPCPFREVTGIEKVPSSAVSSDYCLLHGLNRSLLNAATNLWTPDRPLRNRGRPVISNRQNQQNQLIRVFCMFCQFVIPSIAGPLTSRAALSALPTLHRSTIIGLIT
jgi:hypothetical protein